MKTLVKAFALYYNNTKVTECYGELVRNKESNTIKKVIIVILIKSYGELQKA